MMAPDEMAEGLDFERQMDDMLKFPDGQPRPDGQERLLKYVAVEVRYMKKILPPLLAEHREQMQKGGCAVTVTSGNPQSVTVHSGVPKNIIALASGISSGITLILLLVVLIILWQIGLIG